MGVDCEQEVGSGLLAISITTAAPLLGIVFLYQYQYRMELRMNE